MKKNPVSGTPEVPLSVGRQNLSQHTASNVSIALNVPHLHVSVAAGKEFKLLDLLQEMCGSRWIMFQSTAR